ncbi:TPA: 50S ribosomal protein P1 [Candidatus Woesearchaeota archaeon]|nr:50S ribosomal protein P1 [Candidatus Woesearchaeota archaeon]
MEYIYAALLLHKTGKTVDEAHVKKVLEAAGTHVEEGRVKALLAALEGVDIDEAVKSAAPVAVAAAPAAHAPAAHKEEKKPEKKEEDAAAGLGSLFG